MPVRTKLILVITFCVSFILFSIPVFASSGIELISSVEGLDPAYLSSFASISNDGRYIVLLVAGGIYMSKIVQLEKLQGLIYHSVVVHPHR